MVSVIRTVSGNFNIFITRHEAFVLQGNVTEEELRQLQKKIKEELKDVKRVPNRTDTKARH